MGSDRKAFISVENFLKEINYNKIKDYVACLER